MAGTVPPITPNSITQIRGLDARPVYFLKLNHQAAETLVVKGDAPNAEVSIEWSSKLMKNVNNELVNTKIMTATEIAEFKRAAGAAFRLDSPQHANSLGPRGLTFTWVKMPMVAGLSDAGFLLDRNPKASEIKALVAKFLSEQVWTELGKVVAVDIFNANNDRFQVLSGAASPQGSWSNKGNIMFTTGVPIKVIGLDTFDPASDRSNLSSPGAFNDLRILTDPGRLDAFATACVTDVGNELKRSFRFADSAPAAFVIKADGDRLLKVTLDTMQNLFMPYKDDFAAGIRAGAVQLKTYLQNKVRQYAPLPPPPPMPVNMVHMPLPPPPVVGHAPLRMGQHRGIAPPLPPPPQPPAQMIHVPLPPPPFAPPPLHMAHHGGIAPPLPPPPGPAKTVPQGILDRMAFLGWQV